MLLWNIATNFRACQKQSSLSIGPIKAPWEKKLYGWFRDQQQCSIVEQIDEV